MITKKAAPAAKKKMSPAIQKALEARRNGTSKPRVRKPIPQWEAPADFKPHFLEILVRLDKDGLLSPDIKVIRYKGRYDPEAEDKKKVIVNTYDARTVQGILSRLSMVTFITNASKRLPAGKLFRIVIRVGKRKDNTISISFRGVEAVTKFKSGKSKSVPLDKKDPIYRRFRRVVRILPSAFSKVLLPPKIERRSRKSDDQ